MSSRRYPAADDVVGEREGEELSTVESRMTDGILLIPPFPRLSLEEELTEEEFDAGFGEEGLSRIHASSFNRRGTKYKWIDVYESDHSSVTKEVAENMDHPIVRSANAVDAHTSAKTTAISVSTFSTFILAQL